MDDQIQNGERVQPFAAPSVSNILKELLTVVGKRSKLGLEKATQQGRQGMDRRQLTKDREAMLGKLGREVLALVDGGEVTHPGLVRGAERVRELEDRIARLSESAT